MSFGGSGSDIAAESAASSAITVKASTDANAKISKDVLDFTKAYRTKYLEPALAKVEIATGTASARNTAIYNEQSAQAKDREKTYQSYGKPAINNYFKNVADTNQAGYEERQAQLALGDVSNQEQNANDTLNRDLGSTGSNPNSPAAIAARARLANNAALTRAAQSTRARDIAVRYKDQKVQGAAQFGAGLSTIAPNITNAKVATVGQGAAIPVARLGAVGEAGRVGYPGYEIAANANTSNLNAASATNRSAVEQQQKSEDAESAGWGDLLGTVVGIGAKAAFSSDRRLKKNISFITKTANGHKLYTYEYIWGGGTQIGVMADEAMLITPNAVLRGADGYLMVDYSKLGLGV